MNNTQALTRHDLTDEGLLRATNILANAVEANPACPQHIFDRLVRFTEECEARGLI